jgi:Flp pilus assembly CpaE family ATPase
MTGTPGETGPRPQREQVPYVVAGKALEAAVLRACGTRLSQRDWRTLGTVLALTAAYSKLVDRVYTARLAHLAGMRGKHAATDVQKSLRKLRDLGIIGYEGGVGTSPSTISLPPPVEEGSSDLPTE